MNDLLLLIDIDGTLLTTNGVAINFMIQAAEEETGSKIGFDVEDYLGKLDPQIIETLLRKGGYEQAKIDESKEHVFNRYLQLFEPALREEHVTVYPGVNEFMEYISERKLNFCVLTGNVEAGAKVKLSSIGFDKYFSFGAYGNDADTRPELVPIAVHRARNYFNRDFLPENTWIIGDSVNDIICAKQNGVNCCIVTTGRTDPERLKKMEPDILVDFLKEPAMLLHKFTEISNSLNR